MILDNIKKILDQKEFESTLIPANDHVAFDRLAVFLGFDDKKRERMLEIIEIQQHVSPEFTLPEVNLSSRLHFRLQLPFKVQDLALQQVASLVLFLNQWMDLPGFELNELEGIVSYRYVWMMHPSFIEPALIMNIVEAILLNLGMFTEMIESLADGKVSFNDLLAQITQSIAPQRSSSVNPSSS